MKVIYHEYSKFSLCFKCYLALWKRCANYHLRWGLILSLPFSWHTSGPLKDKRLKTDWNQVWRWYLRCTQFLPSLPSLLQHFHQWLGLMTCLSNLLMVMWFWHCITHLESRNICTVWNDGLKLARYIFKGTTYMIPYLNFITQL